MLVDLKVTDFLTELSSDSPAPGGGSAAALAGSLGAALAAMVCRLTVGNEKYATVDTEVRSILAQAESLQKKLTSDIDEDAQAFEAVMLAFKMPKGTEDEKKARLAAIQLSLKAAANQPLWVAERCLEVLELAVRILPIGNANAASDAAVAGLMAHAAMKGALFNVKINLGSIKDEAYVKETRTLMLALYGKAEVLAVNLANESEKLLG
jgi:formiminotetrahydrofolate cyclodeaminase